MNLDLAHIHIILNHVPSLGCVAAFALLAAAMHFKHDELKKASFLGLVLLALSGLPTYISGAEAGRVISRLPNVAPAMIQVHQNGAMLTIVAMTIMGTFAWFGLWEYRRYSKASSFTTTGTLLTTGLTVALILYTAGLGGKISHPEIRDGADAGVSVDAGWRMPLELMVSDHAWVWPAAETLHFIGMCLLFGVSLLLLMRMLGGVKTIPFAGIHRLLPLAVLGFVFNVLTGMLFFTASPGLYLGKAAFHIKIACIVIAGIPVLYFTLFDEPWETGSSKNASALSKFAAVCTFGLLVVVVIYGRLLPFLN